MHLNDARIKVNNGL